MNRTGPVLHGPSRHAGSGRIRGTEPASPRPVSFNEICGGHHAARIVVFCIVVFGIGAWGCFRHGVAGGFCLRPVDGLRQHNGIGYRDGDGPGYPLGHHRALPGRLLAGLFLVAAFQPHHSRIPIDPANLHVDRAQHAGHGAQRSGHKLLDQHMSGWGGAWKRTRLSVAPFPELACTGALKRARACLHGIDGVTASGGTGKNVGQTGQIAFLKKSENSAALRLTAEIEAPIYRASPDDDRMVLRTAPASGRMEVRLERGSLTL